MESALLRTQAEDNHSRTGTCDEDQGVLTQFKTCILRLDNKFLRCCDPVNANPVCKVLVTASWCIRMKVLSR
jgi:hypothetical protein